MQFASLSARIVAATGAFALCATPVAASVATTAAPAPVINPLVALSVFGSQASAAALCGSAATAAAATAAQQPGCVLPAVDPAAVTPPPAVEPPPPPPPPSGLGFGIAPILLGLAGIAILAALISGSDDRDSDDEPVSPT